MKSMMLSYIGYKSPIERSKSQLKLLLPWFKIHGKGVLKQASDEILIDILKNCTLKSYVKNELIIMQGDFGDKFFIVICGEVNVYVNDISEPVLDKSISSKVFDSDSLYLLGNCVAKEDAGYAFGEYALFDEKSVRKASVVAGTETMLVVISRDSYNESLKNLQKNIIIERESFLNKHPLFYDWNPRIKNLLLMSLKKISFQYDFNIITQGQPWNGLIFITKGSGRLIIDSSKHETLFPEFYPLDFDVYNKRFQEFPELKPPLLTADLTEAEAVETLMPKYIRLKRLMNHPASEIHVDNRKNLSCSIQAGEILGDMEFLLGLTKNLYTVKTMEDIEAFYLDLSNLDRIIKRMNIQKIKERLSQIIKSKLDYREKYFKEIPAPLLLYLKYKLYDRKIENFRPLPKLKTEKKLPPDDLEWQHLLKMYLEDRAALCKPSVKGGIFLKDLMKKNYNHRQNAVAGALLKAAKVDEKVSNNVINYKFPVSQERIYQLQNLTTDSLQFLELLYKEIYHSKREKFRNQNHNKNNNNESINTIEPLNKSESQLLEFDETLPSNNSSDSLNTTKNIHFENNSKKKQSFLSSQEYFAMLQKSEIKFLNSLCSENSQYEIKLNDTPRPNIENRRIYFLPSLQPHVDKQKRIIPTKGAQILVKKYKCAALNTDYALSNHVHDRFKIVEKLEWGDGEKQQINFTNFSNRENEKKLSN